MGWVDNIRNKSPKEKIKTIYIICGVVAGLMLIIWIFTSQIGKQGPINTSVFKAISQGYRDYKASRANR